MYPLEQAEQTFPEQLIQKAKLLHCDKQVPLPAIVPLGHTQTEPLITKGEEQTQEELVVLLFVRVKPVSQAEQALLAEQEEQ